jgi:hypothetical protein
VALGKEFFLKKYDVFAECLAILALGKLSVTVLSPSMSLFFCRGSTGHSAKALPSAREKALGKLLFAV